MSTTTNVTSTGVLWDEQDHLDLETLARSCQVPTHFLLLLVEEGVVEPVHTEPEWRFEPQVTARVQRICRLQRDFEASLPSVGLMLDLLAENDRLRGLLHRAGLAA
jgi:chaperone modulatory protein CbpM